MKTIREIGYTFRGILFTSFHLPGKNPAKSESFLQ